MTPDFDAMERLLQAARTAYDVGDEMRVRSIGYLLGLGAADLKHVGQPETDGPVHPARSQGLQAGVVRADRGDDRNARREGDPA
jgi:hypothetical protein